jgi:hypothetical protein
LTGISPDKKGNLEVQGLNLPADVLSKTRQPQGFAGLLTSEILDAGKTPREPGFTWVSGFPSTRQMKGWASRLPFLFGWRSLVEVVCAGFSCVHSASIFYNNPKSRSQELMDEFDCMLS